MKVCNRCGLSDPDVKFKGGPVRKKCDLTWAVCLACHRHKERARTYGLTPEELDEVLAPGRCAVCLKERGPERDLHVDHDHKTGRVRGLLCATCNRMIGRMIDNPDNARRLQAYLATAAG